MRTHIKSLASLLAGCGLFVTTALAQTPPASLNDALYRSVCARVQAPLVFSTRDTVFALSLPQDEPAEVYVQLTVGKNGKVKEKLTKVHANHIAGYVAPAFIAASKDLRIDRSLLAGMTGKDTSLFLTFPMEYCHVLDTTVQASRANAHPYQSPVFYVNFIKSWWNHNRKFWGDGFSLENPYITQSPRLPKLELYSGPLSFYIVFLKDQPE